MSQPSHQTIKLSRGKHASPESGACVMELASMLAGERFSDHPKAVSRVIGAFLRGYNDIVDDDRRQDLYAYASKVVGTAAGPGLECQRIARLLAWAQTTGQANRQRSILGRFSGPRLARGRREDPEAVGSYAVRAIGPVTSDLHCAVLGVIDELIALGPAVLPLAPSDVAAGDWLPAADHSPDYIN